VNRPNLFRAERLDYGLRPAIGPARRPEMRTKLLPLIAILLLSVTVGWQDAIHLFLAAPLSPHIRGEDRAEPAER
jgi:hypothetical protein